MFAKQTGQDLRYRKIDVPPAQLTQRVAEFFAQGGKGLNLTVPHKSTGLRLAQIIAPRAERAGAVNTLAWQADSQQILGDNTDGVGLVRDLTENIGLDLRDCRVLFCGAGGATRGALAPLLAHDLRAVVIANRNVARAQELAGSFGDLGSVQGCSYDDLTTGPAFDIVINATAAGLNGETPPLALVNVGADTVCYDMGYSKVETPFGRWASAAGCRQVYKGWGMLVEQAAESFLIWRGVRPDTAPVLAVLTEQISY
jgi:shikimate dehydrogenase